MIEETISMIEKRITANKIENVEKRAYAFCDKIFPLLEKIRVHADQLELIVADDLWPLPKYREMLFVK